MELCKISTVMAYVATVYTGASLFYMLSTRSYGTPFGDALKKFPELQKIKNASAKKRRRSFYIGVGVSLLLVCAVRPFRNC